MMLEPKKPRHYVRNKVIIVVLAVIVFFILVKLETPSYFIFPAILSFYHIADGICFKEYSSQKSEYEEKIDAQPAAEKEKAIVNSLYSESSLVNENIAKYKQLQREKRAKAKWWQFWI
jgi:hypothetical protein